MCQIFRILLLVLEKLDYIFKKIHSISNKAKKKSIYIILTPWMQVNIIQGE